VAAGTRMNVDMNQRRNRPGGVEKGQLQPGFLGRLPQGRGPRCLPRLEVPPGLDPYVQPAMFEEEHPIGAGDDPRPGDVHWIGSLVERGRQVGEPTQTNPLGFSFPIVDGASGRHGLRDGGAQGGRIGHLPIVRVPGRNDDPGRRPVSAGNLPGVSDAPLHRTERTRLRRAVPQGSHERSDLETVLDAGWICHLGVIIDGWPMVVPTTYGRNGNSLYLHGSVASRSLRTGARQPVCVTVTHVDGIVIARSLFNHSVNYRSAMVYGTAEVIGGANKLDGLRVIADHVVPGQWGYARSPTTQELAQTTVLRLDLDLASVKTSVGPPGDGDGPDGRLPLWAGEIPVRISASEPVTAPGVPDGTSVPDHLRALAQALAARMAPPSS
jgi:nitroimidazol reductase NimA-like FMN-containing flavoprotein (pyridoxamine 5'-phosphate oxidase superfamily)